VILPKALMAKHFQAALKAIRGWDVADKFISFMNQSTMQHESTFSSSVGSANFTPGGIQGIMEIGVTVLGGKSRAGRSRARLF
jgi:hypothetical protein